MGFPLNVNLQIGSLQIGFLTSGFLFGALTVQALIYNRKFGRDHWTLKLLVAVIWFLELGQISCVAHAIYIVTITQSGNLLALLVPPKTIGASFLLGCAVGPLVEAFYVSRLLRFSGKLYVALVGWSLALARFGGWVFLAVHVILTKSLSDFVDDYGWLFASLLGLSGIIDLTISAWIAYFLARRRSRTRTTAQNESTRQLLDRVILWTLQTGVITSLSFLITMTCYLLLGEYLVWLAVLAILTKVSSNCFLASLNARSPTLIHGRNSTEGYSRRQESRNRGSTSLHNTAHSIVGNIIEMYGVSSDHESSSHFQSIHRTRGSLGNERSVFSPDGTVSSVASSRRSSGYWAI